MSASVKADTTCSRFPIVATASRDILGEREARYKVLWNESQKNEIRDEQDSSRWLKRLRSELGSTDEVDLYLEWVLDNPLKVKKYDLDPRELAVDLEMADWIHGSFHLLHLNSLLTYSITAAPEAIQDLKRQHKGYSLGLQIHGRPVTHFHTNYEEYADKGITVNCDSVLAVCYRTPIDDPTGTAQKEKTMVFAPLGKPLLYRPPILC